MIRYKLTVEFTVTQRDPPGTLAEETENVRDCWLDAVGYPDNVTLEAKGLALEMLEDES